MERQIIQGRAIGAIEIDLIRRLIAENPSWNRSRVSRELCLRWDWRTPTGQLKDMAARSLLRKLAAMGEIALPRKVKPGGGEVWGRSPSFQDAQLSFFDEFDAPDLIADPLSSLVPLNIVVVQEPKALSLFKSLLQEYHYLGFSRSVGQNLKYLVHDQRGRVLACLLFGSSAWRCADRDRFIGWSDTVRAQRLNWTTNNTRFLILPWVRVPHLASHVLGRIMRRIRDDWHAKYAQPLVLVETFVDEARFSGTCYKASNWIRVGETRGRSRNDRYYTLHVPKKAVYVYPLVQNFREVLTV